MKTATILALATVLGISSASAQSSDYPNKPIRLMVPEVPDSATGILASILAPKLSDALGQKVEIVNQFGKAGLQNGARAAADGYTLTYGSAGTLALLPHIDKDTGFDSFNDFAPVSLYAINPTLLATNPALPVANVKDLIALMKAKPHQLKMSTAGAGTAGHFAGELFLAMAGADSQVVHYSGGGPAITAVIDGEAQWTFAPIAGRLPHVRTGKLKAIATGGLTRLAVLPEVPTVAESGVAGYNSVGWAGIFVPKGTPEPVIAKLNAAMVKATANADLQAKVVEQGSEPMSSSAADLGKRLREEYDTLGKVAKTAGMAK